MKKSRVFGARAAAVAMLAASFAAGAWADDPASVPESATASVTAAMASDGTSPKAARQANRALRRKIYAALAKHKEIDAGTLSITPKGGAVTINGTVSEAAQVDEVAAIVSQVPGVTSVSNRLMVQRPFGR
ncbi:BON domain-containing protein [Paraburkholderia sp. J12]|uniref:BON domain-containing protein n=1 Tax=Paraburkholderia sp. J12 TaxID=2805432 RepID=UPI002ABD3AA7|nr:BON domain-containing protein [Paraburkholderia sp. J12]